MDKYKKRKTVILFHLCACFAWWVYVVCTDYAPPETMHIVLKVIIAIPTFIGAAIAFYGAMIIGLFICALITLAGFWVLDWLGLT